MPFIFVSLMLQCKKWGDYMSTVADNIRELRLSRGLTQDAFAEKCGLSRSTVARYESGAVDPSAEALQRIATTFGVSSDRLLGIENIDKESDDIWELREALRRDPERRILFNASSKVKKEDILTAVRILDALKGNGKDGAD